MRVEGAIVVVTGGASGIGDALVAAAVCEGAAAVVLFDRDAASAAAAAERHASGTTVVVAEAGDAATAASIERLVALTEARFGRLDLFCSNAGVMVGGGVDVVAEAWDRAWSVNVMAHVHAARAALPGMLRRGTGHFLNVCSAAGMLTAPGAAPYAVTKHAALGFAEWLAIAHRHQGIGVTAVCPEAVDTPMLAASLASGNAGVRRVAEAGVVLDAAAVATAALTGVKEDRFLIAPHPDTLRNTQRKWSDVDRWVEKMSGFVRSVDG